MRPSENGLILSATDEGQVLVYQVGDLPVDVSTRLRPALVCVRTRQCQNQRMDPAGELGCLALCLLEHLRECRPSTWFPPCFALWPTRHAPAIPPASS